MQVQRIFTFLITAAETVLFAGTLYGWTNMQNVLIKEGFFDHGNSTTLQVERLNLVVTIGTTVAPLLSFLIGFMIDAKGLWFSRTVILGVVALAYVLFALSNTTNELFIFFGAVALNTGNIGIWVANLRISNLFPGYQSFYGYLITGCGISSFGVFFIFNSLYFQFGLSFEHIFYLAAASTLVSHIHTFVLIPRESVKKSVPTNFKYGYKEIQCINSQPVSLDLETINDAEDSQKLSEKTELNLKEKCSDFYEKRRTVDCLKDRKFIEIAARYSYNRLSIAYFFWGNLQNWVDSVSGEDKILSQNLLFFYSLLILCAAFVSPIIGLTFDRIEAKFTADSGLKTAKLKINSLSNVFVDLFLLLFYVCALVPFKPFYYITFCLSLFHICFLYGNLPCFLISHFPAEKFGKLYTIAFAVSAIVGSLQFPCTILTVRFAGFFNMCLFFAGVTFFLLLFSIRQLVLVFKIKSHSGSSGKDEVACVKKLIGDEK